MSQKWKQIDDKQSELQLNALIVCKKQLWWMNIVSKLKEILRVEVKFQGCQQAVIQSIMWEKNCMTQVMSTRERKSLLFMLLAWCSFSEVSVVVVLLIALCTDMLVWCQDLQILCAEWNSQHQEKYDEKWLVFVMPESAVEKMFRLWMVRKKVAQQLDQIYIDECYVMLNNWTDFWWKLQEMSWLNSVRVQIVLLMATLLLSCECKLWRWISWKKLQV